MNHLKYFSLGKRIQYKLLCRLCSQVFQENSWKDLRVINFEMHNQLDDLYSACYTAPQNTLHYKILNAALTRNNELQLAVTVAHWQQATNLNRNVQLVMLSSVVFAPQWGVN